MTFSNYETEKLLNQYLLFHYGSEGDQLAFPFGPLNSLNFPVRCVTECLDSDILPEHATALDLGCSVGRSSFELTRYCEHVVALDSSRMFISAAKELQQKGELKYSIIEEGKKTALRLAQIPPKADVKRVEFMCIDIMAFFKKSKKFDVVLAANILCRLPYPLKFLKLLHTLVTPDGQLILISPYSWLEEFTQKSHWINKKTTDEILQEHFQLLRSFEMSYLIREHARHYEWGVSNATIWKLK